MNQTSQQPSLKEKQSHGTRLFPCAYYHFCNPSHRLRVRHHWHEEVEIVYLHHGSFKLDINMEPYGTDRECFLFINSGELHSLRSLSMEFDEQAVVFSPSMLLFQDYDSIDESILLPLTQNKLTFPRFLDQTSPFFLPSAAVINRSVIFFREAKKLCSPANRFLRMMSSLSCRSRQGYFSSSGFSWKPV